MKKTTLAIALCTVMVTANTYASQFGGYAGLSIGKTSNEEDFAKFKDTTVKLLVGYKINNLVAIEGHYAKMDDTQSGANLEVSTMGVSAVITPIQNNKLSPFVKVGFNKLSADSSTHILADDSESSVSFGAGLQMKLSNTVSIRSEYEKFDNDTDMLSVGGVYKF
jgi:opacity protein-like surface antigen